MKTLKYFAAFLAAVLVLGACDKGDGLSQQNKDKEKPYVTLSQKVADDVTLTFEITASEDAKHYAYAVFAGSDNAVPAAYDILVGETSGADDGAFPCDRAAGDGNGRLAVADRNDQTVLVNDRNIGIGGCKDNCLGRILGLQDSLKQRLFVLILELDRRHVQLDAGAEHILNGCFRAFQCRISRGRRAAAVRSVSQAGQEHTDADVDDHHNDCKQKHNHNCDQTLVALLRLFIVSAVISAAALRRLARCPHRRRCGIGALSYISFRVAAALDISTGNGFFSIRLRCLRRNRLRRRRFCTAADRTLAVCIGESSAAYITNHFAHKLTSHPAQRNVPIF